MKYYLISIGGTGAKCLEAFVHMNAAGLMKSDGEVKIIYVDPDANNGNLSKTRDTVKAYKNSFNVMAQKKDFFKNSLFESESVWNPVPGNSDRDLSEIFLRASMNDSLGSLFDVLFSKTEQTTKLNEGFRGHPSIGAAVIGLNMDMKEDASVWKAMADDIKEEDARIFFFGSVFGGTGAAGFPNIAKIIRQELDKKSGEKVKMAGCLMLPYFDFISASDNDKRDKKTGEEIIVPDPTKFKASTYAALNYYDKNSFLRHRNPDQQLTGVFDALYLLGDTQEVDMGEYHDGGNDQENKAHFLEMLAALAALDFFNKESSDDFKDPKSYMLALHGKDFQWIDLPSVGLDMDNNMIVKKIRTFIRMAYMYRTTIFPKIRGYYEGKVKIKDIKRDVWIENWLRGRKTTFQSIRDRVLSDSGKNQECITKEEYDAFSAFYVYCVRFLDGWLKDFTNPYDKTLRCHALLNEKFFIFGKRSEEDDDDKKTFEENSNRGKIINPAKIFIEPGTSIFDKQQELEFHTALINRSEGKTEDTGVKYLLAQVYALLKDE